MEELVLSSESGLSIENRIEYSLEEESALIEQAKSDPLAFGRLFDRYYNAILNYILHRTANISLAEELTSDTFYKALDKLWTFRWKNVPFSAWLFRIASNEVNGYYRKNKNRQTISISGYEDLIPDELSETDREILEAEKVFALNKLYLNLHDSISALKPKYQEVITLRFFDDKSIKEICDITGKSDGTVKSLIHRGIALLRSKIDASIFQEI